MNRWKNRPLAADAKKPFHVINTALNLVSGSKLAWQQRKAESFTISPLHCGGPSLASASGGAYRRADDYGMGAGSRSISIGTALTISGAAASPNMGYHSSPGVAFLLTLFNVRLGAWLGNPGPAGDPCFPLFSKKPYQLASPRWAVGPILKEAFGLTDDTSPYVYLSDGGHFENLGIYEMVRRRCHYIIVCDGGADPDYKFDDLVNAIRKIRTDLGIRIKIDVSELWPQPGTKSSHAHCALGWIYYNDVDPAAEPGQLLYLKASLNNNEPLDVRSYADEHPDFPHQSTGDQFFDESQFESYRALGLHVARETFNKAQAPLQNLQQAFTEIARHWPPPARPPRVHAAGKPAAP